MYIRLTKGERLQRFFGCSKNRFWRNDIDDKLDFGESS